MSQAGCFYSSPVLMNAWMKVYTAEKDGRRREMLLRWKKAVLVMWFRCIKFKLAVKNDSEDADVRGGGKSAVVEGEVEVKHVGTNCTLPLITCTVTTMMC